MATLTGREFGEVVERHHALVDMLYLRGLSVAEHDEMTALEVQIDAHNEPHLEPIIARLEAALAVDPVDRTWVRDGLTKLAGQMAKIPGYKGIYQQGIADAVALLNSAERLKR